MKKQDRELGSMSRRDFLKTSAVSAALLSTGGLAFAQGVPSKGSDELRVGLIGCGGRGTGAAADCATSSPGVKIVALGDLFQDFLECVKTGRTPQVTGEHGREALALALEITAQIRKQVKS